MTPRYITGAFFLPPLPKSPKPLRTLRAERIDAGRLPVPTAEKLAAVLGERRRRDLSLPLPLPPPLLTLPSLSRPSDAPEKLAGRRPA
jgi:hypothetical protein